MIQYLCDLTFTWFTPIRVLLAVAVSIHVLLHKRDTSASIGWIGLAWFSPIIGCVLYLLFGINRVTRRAAKIRRRVHIEKVGARNPSPQGRADYLAPLEIAAGRITRRPPEGGNGVAMMHNGDEGYPKMLEAIEAAKFSVAMSSYIFHADEAGDRFIDALARARTRGLEVRVIIDGIGGGYWHSAAYHRLVAKGVRAERFLHSHLPWRMSFLNLRLHKKVLVLDGRVGFTGGLNIGDENVLAKDPPKKVRDTHFRFDGPVVAQLMEAFARDWLFVANEDLSGDAWFPQLETRGEATARVVTSGPDQDLEKIAYLKLQAITCARKTIRILTPYFLPDRRIESALAMAATRGVEVDIIIPEKSDHRVMDWVKGTQVEPLIEAGVRIWSNPPPFEHSKLMTVDGQWCLLGSANWDMRSLRLNFEQDMEVYHSDLAGRVEDLLKAKMVRLITKAELKARSLPERLRSSAARLALPYL